MISLIQPGTSTLIQQKIYLDIYMYSIVNLPLNYLYIVIILKNRCEVLDFQLSKSQKKIIKKVTKFLKSGECDKNPINFEQAEREPCMKYEFHGNFYLLLLLSIYPIYIYVTFLSLIMILY